MGNKEKKSGGVGYLAALEDINKELGAGSAYEYKNYTGEPQERLRTGSIGLDIATGGGWAVGLMNYISGWESSGKSTLGLYAVRNTQEKGGRCAYIDHEYSFDKKYAESLGVNVDDMILAQPNIIEDGYLIALKLMESGEVDTVIFDSIAGAVTRREMEGEIGDSNMGVKAKLNSQTFPKLQSAAKKYNVTLIMVNQLREKLGVMFGSPITEPGGNALKFSPSIKIQTAQSTKAKDGKGDEITGNLVKAKCTKNKTAPPFKTADYSIIYGEGIDRLGEIITWGEHFGIVTKAGSWFSISADVQEIGGVKLGQGIKGARATLKDNPELAEALEDLIYQMAEI
jgi:recombination protein RecA